MTQDMTKLMHQQSKRAVENILYDLRGRRGIGNELESYSDDILQEISEMMETEVFEAIASVIQEQNGRK